MGMNTPNNLEVVYADVIAEHHTWLQRFERLKKWEDLLKANPEAAICEAKTQKFLSDNNINVQPYRDLTQKGPDFLCVKDGKTFCVEVTCITRDIATQKTTLSSSYLNPKKAEAQCYKLLTRHILGELCNKTPQCSGMKMPCVVAIATLHTKSGVLCFKKTACENILTATTQIAMDVDIQKGHSVGEPYQTTSLEDSAFIRFTKKDDGTIEYARNPISTILLCAFGQYPISVKGLLHPKPNYPFDRSLLHDTEFAVLADEYQNGKLKLKVEWI
jgi:hypothetical protein